MDLFTQLFMRLALWIRNPPSRRQIYAAGVAVVLCLIIYGIERAGYWPHAFHVNPGIPRLPGKL